MRFLIPILLALAALFSVDSKEEASVPVLSESYEDSAMTEPETPFDPLAELPYVPEEPVPAYYEYDTREFYRDCSELMSVLSMWPDPDVVNDTYDKLYQEYLIISSLDSSAYLDYSRDVSSAENSRKSLDATALAAECANELCVACHAVMNGPNAESFALHVGQQAAKYFRSYSEVSGREDELFRRESELINEYYTAQDTVYGFTYSYDGRDWTQNDLYSRAGDRLYEADFEGYWEVSDALEKQANDLLGPIFVELVEVRDEIAEINGYDSYADYAYEIIYGRDFTTADAAYFCEQVKNYVSPEYYDEVFYSGYGAAAEEALSAAELVDQLGQYAGSISPELRTAWEDMTRKHLYDIGSESCRMESCYTLDLPASGMPFIFQKLNGEAFDFATLTHEFGHFYESWKNGVPNRLTSPSDFDLSEVHSNGLEVLYTHFYREIYGRGEQAAVYEVLADQLAGVVDGCIFDEFQRRVYAKGSVTVDEVNRIYCDVCREFGEDESGDVDYFWMYVGHNFESPMYYISYAASSLAALQIWDLSREDFDAAAALWMAVVDEGSCGDGYLTVLERCGMQSFMSDGAVGEICRPVLDHLERILKEAYDPALWDMW